MLTDIELDISRDEGLLPCQLTALLQVREHARIQHDAALPKLRERAKGLGFSPADVHATLEWIMKEVPILIPMDLEKIGLKLMEDTQFRNQFETESCEPLEDCRRVEYEDALFHGSYNEVQCSARCKYAVLNVTSDASALQQEPGWPARSYLQLRNVRHRTTFTMSEGTGASFFTDLKFADMAKLGTCDYCAHVLEEYTDAGLCAAIKVGSGRSTTSDASIPQNAIEAHIHGDVKLSEDIGLIMVNPLALHHRLCSESASPIVEKLAEHCKAAFVWMDIVRPEEQEPLLGHRTATSYSAPHPLPAAGPEAARRVEFQDEDDEIPAAPAAGPKGAHHVEFQDEDEELQAALKASLQFADDERRFYAQSEAQELALALEASAPSAPAELQVLEPLIDLTQDLLGPLLEREAFVAEASCADALVGSSSEYTLKASLGTDVRRFRVSWCSAASAQEIASAIQASVDRTFDLEMTEHCLKYEDEDGDLCTLVAATVQDYLSSGQGSALKKVHVCRAAPEKTPSGAIAAVTEPSAGNGKDTHLAPSMQDADSADHVLATSQAADKEYVAALKIQALQRGRKARALLDGQAADKEHVAALKIQALQRGRKARAARARNSAAAKIQTLQRSRHARAASKAICVRKIASAVKIQSLQRGLAARASIRAARVETSKMHMNVQSALSETESEAAELVAPPTPPMQQFSIVTPPTSPRGQSGDAARASSIEDEYHDDFVSWTFVAEPAE